jgi:hypothetical protein
LHFAKQQLSITDTNKFNNNDGDLGRYQKDSSSAAIILHPFRNKIENEDIEEDLDKSK